MAPSKFAIGRTMKSSSRNPDFEGGEDPMRNVARTGIDGVWENLFRISFCVDSSVKEYPPRSLGRKPSLRRDQFPVEGPGPEPRPRPRGPHDQGSICERLSGG